MVAARIHFNSALVAFGAAVDLDPVLAMARHDPKPGELFQRFPNPVALLEAQVSDIVKPAGSLGQAGRARQGQDGVGGQVAVELHGAQLPPAMDDQLPRPRPDKLAAHRRQAVGGAAFTLSVVFQPIERCHPACRRDGRHQGRRRGPVAVDAHFTAPPGLPPRDPEAQRRKIRLHDPAEAVQRLDRLIDQRPRDKRPGWRPVSPRLAHRNHALALQVRRQVEQRTEKLRTFRPADAHPAAAHPAAPALDPDRQAPLGSHCFDARAELAQRGQQIFIGALAERLGIIGFEPHSPLNQAGRPQQQAQHGPGVSGIEHAARRPARPPADPIDRQRVLLLLDRGAQHTAAGHQRPRVVVRRGLDHPAATAGQRRTQNQARCIIFRRGHPEVSPQRTRWMYPHRVLRWSHSIAVWEQSHYTGLDWERQVAMVFARGHVNARPLFGLEGTSS
ncbi:MAG: hypothetical protein BWZ08_02746 [candidate division BRC1 bacterium ADurb.BinA292]|nr:MAG: hypothetical protein BWZ08_02746 [candidate division BRC1 bacterium ADurb.BinA292]